MIKTNVSSEWSYNLKWLKQAAKNKLQFKQMWNVFGVVCGGGGGGGRGRRKFITWETIFISFKLSPNVAPSVVKLALFIWFGEFGVSKENTLSPWDLLGVQFQNIPLLSAQKHSNQAPAVRLKCIWLFS